MDSSLLQAASVQRVLRRSRELLLSLYEDWLPLASRAELVHVLINAYGDVVSDADIEQQLERFVSERPLAIAATLRRLAHRRVPAAGPAPEYLMLLERLWNARDALSRCWPPTISRRELEEVALASGRPLDPATRRDSVPFI